MKKFLVVLLTFVISATIFAGCGGGPTPDEKVDGEMTPFGKYDNPLEITTVKYTYDTRVLSELTGITGETLEDNRWTRAFKDELNIDVKYLFEGTGDTFIQQWKATMASGDLPHIAIVDSSDYKQLVEADQIYDVTDLYSTMCSPILNEVLDEAGQEIKDSLKINGRVYGIPMPISQYDSYKYLWIRRDWLKKIGKTEGPKTRAELVEIMEAFAKNEGKKLTDGKDKKTYAFAVGPQPWVELEGFFWCYDAYADGWIYNENGKMMPGQNHTNMKKPLSLIQDFFQKGYLDREYESFGRREQQIANGQAGIYMGPHFTATTILDPSRVNDPDADWAVFPWPGEKEGDSVTGQLSLERNRVLVATKKTSNPEVIFKMSNLYFEKLYGKTGDYEHWGNDEIDFIWSIGPLYAYRPNVNLIPYRDVMKVIKNEMKVEQLSGLSKDYYKRIVKEKRYDWIRMFGDNAPTSTGVSGGQSAGYFLDKVEKGEIPTFVDRYVGPPTESAAESGVTLMELSENYFNDVFKGIKNTTTDFDEFVNKWLSSGGQKLTEEVQAWKDSLS